tara:strand:- start:950 stop:1615 length:666 start_codon:yes stop_codon:yes gene_type:complete
MPQQKNKKIIIYFFLFLMIGTLNNKNFNSIHFTKINEITIKGLDEKNNLQLMNDINYMKFDNLFYLNKSKLIEIIDANSLVENFSVFKKYPSTLNIKIDKTNFLAKLKKNGESFILGSNGKLIKLGIMDIDVPFIFGDLEVKNFFEFKKTIDESDLNYNEIKKLFFFKSGRWDIETKNDILIKLPKDGIKEALNFFINFPIKNKKINMIDLRQKNQIVTNE